MDSVEQKQKSQSQSMTLNAAIGIVGVLLLGFIYSFSRNVTHTGVPIEVTFPKIDSRRLAELNTHPSGDSIMNVPDEYQKLIPEFIKQNVDLDRFSNA